MKKISVIVPVYKVEKYLVCCIESIIHQTYSNLEIILIDDGSPDHCGEICDNYAAKDERIKVIHQENGGLSEARNAGIQQATGEYLLFADSDDWLASDLCENALRDAQEQQSDIVVFGYYLTSETGEVEKIEVPYDSQNISGKEAMRRLFSEEIKDYAWNKLYARELFQGISYPKGRLFEDVGTTYRVFAKAKKVSVTNRALYFYRQRGSSISGQATLKSQMDYCDMCFGRYEEICRNWQDLKEAALSHMIPVAVGTYGFLCSFKNAGDYQRKLLEFVIHQKEVFPSHPVFQGNRYITFFLNHRKLFTLYYKIGISKLDKLHNILGKLLSLSFFVKQDKLDMPKQQGKSRCYLIGTPEHDNLGDHAIGISTEDYLKTILHGYEIIAITEEEYKRVKKDLKKQCTRDDIIVLQGGGNLGDEYRYIERIRKHVLKNFRGQRIILFPQTIFFTNTIRGKIWEKAAKSYYWKSGAILTAREQSSYNKMKQLFPKNQVYLLPDIVLLLNVKKTEQPRQGALICLRKDAEVSMNWKQRMKIYDICQKYYRDVRYTDTASGIYYSRDNANEALHKKLEQFSRSRLVVTDRLHGMVFAVLTGTPCIVFSNYNGKVKGVYKWISYLNYIEFQESFEGLESTLKRLSELEEKTPFSREEMMEKYQDIEKILKKWSK